MYVCDNSLSPPKKIDNSAENKEYWYLPMLGLTKNYMSIKKNKTY